MSESTRQGRLWLTAGVVSALLVVLLLGLPTVAPSPSLHGAALQVHVDPETGEIVPVPVTGLDKAELDRQMKARLNRSSEGLTEVHHPDGRVSIDLAGRFQSLSVATTDSTGQVKTGCVTTAKELDQFMANPDTQNVETE